MAHDRHPLSFPGPEFTRHEWGTRGGEAEAWVPGHVIPTRGAAVSSSYYEIRVAGVLPPEALLDFERLTASVEPVETVVHGPLRDQAALNGLLARLEIFGIQVLEVRRVYDRDPPAGDETGP